MATATSNLVIRARADTNNAQRNMNRLSQVGRGLTRVIGAIGIAAAATGAALVSMARESLAQEEVFRRLEDSLQRAGIAYGDVSDEIARFAAERQRMTRFGDDQTAAVLSRVAQLTQSLGPSMDQLQDMTVLTQDIAEATGRDSERIAEYVARAFAGTTEGLDRLIPAHREYLQEINNIEDAHERAALVTELLRSEFDGFAEAIPETTLALSRLQNGMGDFREALGAAALEGIEATGALGNTADAIDYLAASIDPASDKANALGDAIEGMARTSANAVVGLARLVIQTFVDLKQESLRLEGFLESGRESRAEADIERLESILEGNRFGNAIRSGAGGVLGGIPGALLNVGQAQAEGTLSDLQLAQIAVTESREEIQARIDRLRGVQDIAQAAQLAAAQASSDLEQSLAEFESILQSGAQPETGGPTEPQIFRPGLSDFPEMLRRPAADDEEDAASATTALGNAFDSTAEKARRAKLETGLAREEYAAMTAVVTDLATALGTIGQSGETAAMERMALAAEMVAEKFDRFKESTVAASMEQGRSLKQMEDQLDSIRTGALASFVESAAAGFGTIAIEGGNAGQMIARASLQSIGQMASAMGRMFILAGIAGQAVPFLGMKLTGPTAVVAGASLVALGSSLGSAASGIGRGGGGGGGAGPTGVGESFENTISRPNVTRMDYAGMIVISEDEKTVNRLTRMTDRSREMGVTRNTL